MTTNFSVFTSCAGHSAKSPGAGANGYKEHEQARLCNDEFIKIMKKYGHGVINTTSDGKNKMAVLQEQVAKANKINAGEKQLDISFHLNAGGGTGVEVYYYSDSAKTIASDISSAIASTLGIKNRGAKQNKELYFLRHTKATAILVEVCFIDSASDMRQLVNKRTEAMTAVAEVLIGPFFSSTESSTESTAPTAKSTYQGNSIVDYLKSLNLDSSFSNRARLAVSYGVVTSPSHYHGTASQNSQLLAYMREAAK